MNKYVDRCLPTITAPTEAGTSQLGFTSHQVKVLRVSFLPRKLGTPPTSTLPLGPQLNTWARKAQDHPAPGVIGRQHRRANMSVLSVENREWRHKAPSNQRMGTRGYRTQLCALISIVTWTRWVCTMSQSLEGTLKTCLAGHPGSLLIKALELSFLFF